MRIKHIKSAGSLIRNNDGQILTFKRGEPLNDFSFPKGRIDKGEDAISAAVRETLEETGLKVKVVKSLGKVKYDYYWEPTDTHVKKSVDYFLAEIVSGNLDKSLNNEDFIEKFLWLSKSDLLKCFEKKQGMLRIIEKL